MMFMAPIAGRSPQQEKALAPTELIENCRGAIQQSCWCYYSLHVKEGCGMMISHHPTFTARKHEIVAHSQGQLHNYITKAYWELV